YLPPSPYGPSQPQPRPYAPPAPPTPQMPLRPPAGSNASYAAHLLFGESALPEWLRPVGVPQGSFTPPAMPMGGHEPAMGNPSSVYGTYNGSSPYPPQPAPPEPSTSSAFPSLDYVGSGQGPIPPTGLNGAALIDPRALPAWLGGQPSDESVS